MNWTRIKTDDGYEYHSDHFSIQRHYSFGERLGYELRKRTRYQFVNRYMTIAEAKEAAEVLAAQAEGVAVA